MEGEPIEGAAEGLDPEEAGVPIAGRAVEGDAGVLEVPTVGGFGAAGPPTGLPTGVPMVGRETGAPTIGLPTGVPITGRETVDFGLACCCAGCSVVVVSASLRGFSDSFCFLGASVEALSSLLSSGVSADK